MVQWDDLLSEHDREVMAAGVKIRKTTGFGERPALLVIDMNIGAVGEDRPIYEQLDRYPLACGPYAWAAIRQIQKLLPAAREASIPIIYSKHIFKASHGLPRHDDPTYSFSELSPLSEFHPETFPQEGDLIIEKQRGQRILSDPPSVRPTKPTSGHPYHRRQLDKRVCAGYHRGRQLLPRIQSLSGRRVCLRPHRVVPQGRPL